MRLAYQLVVVLSLFVMLSSSGAAAGYVAFQFNPLQDIINFFGSLFAAAPSSCTNDYSCSSFGQRVCDSQGKGFYTCGYYDADSCLDIDNSHYTACTSGTCSGGGNCIQSTRPGVCKDLDGDDPYTASSVTNSNGGTFTDKCNGNVLQEGVCGPDGLSYSIKDYPCANGCQSGACLRASTGGGTGTCTDTDSTSTYPNGNNPYARGTATASATATYAGGSSTDYCSGNTLNEFYCDANKRTSPASYDCSTIAGYVCSNGACVASAGSSQCANLPNSCPTNGAKRCDPNSPGSILVCFRDANGCNVWSSGSCPVAGQVCSNDVCVTSGGATCPSDQFTCTQAQSQQGATICDNQNKGYYTCQTDSNGCPRWYVS